ncbi:MAG: alpha/beta hydrolase family protein, partial [Eubacteriales bacterium]
MKKCCVTFLLLASLWLSACQTGMGAQPADTNNTAKETTAAVDTLPLTDADTDADTQEDASLPGQSAEETEPPAPDAFDVTEMRVTRGNLSIYGRLYTPVGAEGKYPAVILSHSANMTSDSMNSYCQRLAAMGYVAYAFDFCGGSKNSRSDGAEEDMTVFTEVEDLEAVLEAVRGLDCVDGQSVYLFGTSQGGLVSALTAAAHPDAVQGLMLFYPAFNIAELAEKFGSFMTGNAGSLYISTLQGYDVYEHITPYTGDVLIVHGTKDFIVSSSYAEKAADL